MSALLKMLRLSSVSRLAGTSVVAARPTPSPRTLATGVKASAVGKKELVAAVAREAGLDAKSAEKAVSSLLETIVGNVAKGQKVTVVGFGTFEARTRAARKGRNPATGAELFIPETTAPAFSAGKTFKERVKDGK